MMQCCQRENIEHIKDYNPMPRNPNGSVKWFLYRWDDGKTGMRRLVRCHICGKLFLVQAYHLNKFSEQKDILFEDYYSVKDEREADYLNRNYTGIQLEHTMSPAFTMKISK